MTQAEIAREEKERFRVAETKKFAHYLAIAATLLAALPVLIGWMSAPRGTIYLFTQSSVDDQMVYAAWMHQAVNGKLLFRNLFAVDPQPGLTFHVYFLVLGWISKITGIPLALTLGRLVGTFLAVKLLGKLVIKLGIDLFAAKTALVFASIGGGLGFLFWQRFGESAVDAPAWAQSVLNGRCPIDVWQTEAFLFPSMLVNGLFMVSFCLALGTLLAVLEARESWSSVAKGALCFGVLMNVHSYDTLLFAMVATLFVAVGLWNRSVSLQWAARIGTIGLGALPPAAYFLFVLQRDPVFQARAATPTFSATIAQELVGILPFVLLAIAGLLAHKSNRMKCAGAAVLLVFAALAAASVGHDTARPFLTGAGFAAVLVAIGLCAALASNEDPNWNLLVCWSLVASIAPLFPAMFQRKLAMGLVVPWAVWGAICLNQMVKHADRSSRNLAVALGMFLAAGTSLLWLRREIEYIRLNVARTAVQPVVYGQDVAKIMALLDKEQGSKVVVCMPGVWNPTGPAEFGPPVIPDLNPLLSGLAGCTTYAGHWSETPNYGNRRAKATAVFLTSVPRDVRLQVLKESEADFIVGPNKEAFPALETGSGQVELVDASEYGETVFSGNQFALVRVRRPR